MFALVLTLGAGILAVVIRSPDRKPQVVAPPPAATTQEPTLNTKQTPLEIVATTFPDLPPSQPFDDPHLVRLFRAIHPTLPAAELQGLTSFDAGTFNGVAFSVIVTPSGYVCLIGNLGPGRSHFIGTHCAPVADAINPRKTMVGRAAGGFADDVGGILYMLAVPGIKGAAINVRGTPNPAATHGALIYGSVQEFWGESYTITLTDGTSYNGSLSGPA